MAAEARLSVLVVETHPASQLVDLGLVGDDEAAGDIDRLGVVATRESGHVAGDEDPQFGAVIFDVRHHAHVDPAISDAEKSVRAVAHVLLSSGEPSRKDTLSPPFAAQTKHSNFKQCRND